MKRFVYYQPNKMDLKDNYGDCVVRSLCKAMNKEWIDVFKELCSYAEKLQCMPNSKPCYEMYAKNNGFVYTGISNKKGTKRPTVDSFSKEHKQGTYILIVANHNVTCVDGQYFDTWDSGEKSLYGYWKKEN